MAKKKPDVFYTLRVPADLDEAVRKQAEKEDRRLTDMFRLLFRRGLTVAVGK